MLGFVPVHLLPTLWDIEFFPAIAAQRSIFKATFVKLGDFFSDSAKHDFEGCFVRTLGLENFWLVLRMR